MHQFSPQQYAATKVTKVVLLWHSVNFTHYHRIVLQSLQAVDPLVHQLYRIDTLRGERAQLMHS